MDWIRPNWPLPPRVRSLITTRAGGVSEGPYGRMNLGMHVGDRPEAVRANRDLLRRVAELPAEPAWLTQIHGIEVLELEEAPAATPVADGAVSSEPGVVLCILTADCLPILLADQAGDRIGALHAGWRGLAGGIVEAGVGTMKRPPHRLHAYLGPGIGAAAYEVGDDVREAFLQRLMAAQHYFAPTPQGRWLADMYGLARLFLCESGLAAENIHGGGFCTFGEAKRFFSYRREGATGRMASLLWLESDRRNP